MVCKGNLAPNWEFFRQQWEDCLRTFLNLNISVEIRNNVEACMTALEKYFKPQRKVVHERYFFNSCEQNQGESVDSYVTRLRKFASSCKFGMLTNELIRNQLVTGIIDRRTKGKLSRKKSLTLDRAIDITRSNEITSKQLETRKSDTAIPSKEAVNLVGKENGENFKKQPSGDSKHKKNRFPGKKKPKTAFLPCLFLRFCDEILLCPCRKNALTFVIQIL